MLMHHPVLETTVEVPDVDATIAVLEESGWERVDQAEAEQHPGLVDGQPGTDDDAPPAEPTPRRRRSTEATTDD